MEVMLLLKLCGAFIVLSFLELVLVVDNALVIIIMCKGVPEEKRQRAQKLAILQGALIRIVLILLIGFIAKLMVPIPYVSEFMHGMTGHEFTIKSLVNLIGGLILIGMSAHHIRGEWKRSHKKVSQSNSIGAVLVKTFGVSLIFSIDSVMSAVGTVDNLWVAGAAVLLAACVMVVYVNPVSEIFSRYPDLKSLGLAFVLYVGGILVAEGFGYHIPKALVYLPLGFALFVQMIDIMRDRADEQEANPGGKRKAEMSTEELAG